MKTLWQSLGEHSQQRGSRVAIRDDISTISYRELDAEINRRERQLKENGTQTLALALPNGIDWVCWDLAALKAGIRCVPLPPFFNRQQIAHVMADAQVDSIIDPHGYRMLLKPRLYASSSSTTQISKITYTSGSTGKPKGVCLTAEGLDLLCTSIVEAMDADTANHHLSVMPLAVLLENVAGVYPALIAGCTVHMPDCRELMANPRSLIQAVSLSNANTAILVPELLRGLVAALSEGESRDAYPESLQYLAVGGARVSGELIADAARFGLPVYQGYGLSESGSVVSMNTPRNNRPGTAGKVLPHLNVRVERGELVITNPVAHSYLNQKPFQTLHTGDCGQIDEDGYLSIQGRVNHLLITSWGRNINPEWPEALLLDHPCIAQALVVGDAQQSLSALVVPRAQSTVESVNRAIQATNSELPVYAQLRSWRQVDPFTRCNGQLTGNGRPVRKLINQLYAQGQTRNDYHVL